MFCGWFLSFFFAVQVTSVFTYARALQEEVVVKLNSLVPIHIQSDDHPYICVTLDWWPNNKCDSVDGESNCAWVNASILSAPIHEGSRLQKAAHALGKFTLRLGGTLADSIVYDLSDEEVKCPDFSPAPPDKAKLFTDGCLRASRWDEVLQLCPNSSPSKCDMVFGLNGMTNRTCVNVDPSRAPCFYSEATCSDTFDFSNIERMLRYTAAKGYTMKGYEFGNELTCLSPEQYASSLKQLELLIVETTKDSNSVPFLIATDSKDPDPDFFSSFVPLVDSILHAASWHSYPLQAGVYCSGPGATNNSAVDDIIMDPRGMDEFINSAGQMSTAVQQASPSVQIWMGETGGAYDSGCSGSTNAFMSGFWYLHSMAAFAVQKHDMFCRQTFTGGNYELVNKVTNIPNPDYYSTQLFGELMGKKVLDVSAEQMGAPATSVRLFAHCTAEMEGLHVRGSDDMAGGSVTLMYLNYDEKEVLIYDDAVKNGSDYRWEYILSGVYNPKSPAADALHSDLIALNGELLVPNPATGDLPQLFPRVVNGTASPESRLRLPGHSYGFIVYPFAALEVCL